MAFKMKGSSLYGKMNLNRGGYENMADGKSKSSAFQQTDSDLKEYLLSERGFNPKDADLQMKDGSYDLNDAGFKKWFETSSKSDNQKKDVDGDLASDRINQPVAKEEDPGPPIKQKEEKTVTDYGTGKKRTERRMARLNKRRDENYEREYEAKQSGDTKKAAKYQKRGDKADKKAVKVQNRSRRKQGKEEYDFVTSSETNSI